MEADSLRWWLLILGSLVIVGLAVHGIWLSRKNSEKKAKARKHKKEQEFQPSGWQADDDKFDKVVDLENVDTQDDSSIKFDIGNDDLAFNADDSTSINNDFDDLGVGAVRVVSSEKKTEVDIEEKQILSSDIQAEPETKAKAEADQDSQAEPELEPQASTSKIYASVVTQPKPEYAAKYTSLAAETVAISQQERATSNKTTDSQKIVASQFPGATNNGFNANDNYQAPEPPPFLLKKEVTDPENTADTNIAAEQPNSSLAFAAQNEGEDKTSTNSTEKLSLSEQARNLVKGKKAESVRKRREPKIAEDQMRIDFDDQPNVEPVLKEEPKTEPTKAEEPQEVLVLNVKSADDNPIPGAALLPMLLTLGFKFGDQDIFHRHVNSNGKGPVLFSLANMFKPGNFDIDNLENFTTQGISLFMILPIEGEPHQVFNMMHNAARKIAEEFSAQIYDGRRNLLTKQSLQQYVEKIREFERQRLLRG